MTKLLYLESMHQLQCEANVVAVEEAGELKAVVLDATVFYPQGGGQPSDTGTITNDDAHFRVAQVRWGDGRVLHLGSFERGAWLGGESVRCNVDRERRELNTRLHSAGHIVDMAVNRIGLDWIPGKGYHFPDGPYVEYSGKIDGDKETLRAKIEEEANAIVAEGIATRVLFMDRSELASVCRFVPEYVPAGKPSRVVMYGDFGVPCGGTHVATLGDVGRVRIRKMKAGGETMRVSYAID